MTRSAKLGLVLALAASWTSMSAHADIPPPDTCGEAGEACENAGPTFEQPGTCFQRTCSKGPPGEEVTYECLRCEAAGEGGEGGAGGTAPNPGTGGGNDTGGVSATGGKQTGGAATGGKAAATGGAETGGKATAGSSSKPPKKDDSDDGCSVGGVGAERGFAGSMLLLGLALLGRGRRR